MIGANSSPSGVEHVPLAGDQQVEQETAGDGEREPGPTSRVIGREAVAREQLDEGLLPRRDDRGPERVGPRSPVERVRVHLEEQALGRRQRRVGDPLPERP